VTIWDRLGVPPGSNRAAIRHAYAAKLRVTNPEDDAEGFKYLRDAYELALRTAEQGGDAHPLSGGAVAAPRTAGPTPAGSRTEVVPEEPDDFVAADGQSAHQLDADRLAIDDAEAKLSADLCSDDPAAHERAAAAMDRLLALPALQNIALRGAVEQWLAMELAGSVPRSDPLLNKAAQFFSWDRPGYRAGSPAIFALLRRQELWRQIEAFGHSDHALHHAWLMLSQEDRPRWRRALDMLNPHRRGQVRALLTNITHLQPGLGEYAVPELLARWQAHLARPRVGDALPLLPMCWILSAAIIAAAGGMIVANRETIGTALLAGSGIGILYALLLRQRLVALYERRPRQGGSPYWIGGLFALPALGLLLPASPAGLLTASVSGATLLCWQDVALSRFGSAARPVKPTTAGVRYGLLLCSCVMFLGAMSAETRLLWLTVAAPVLQLWHRGKGSILQAAMGMRPAWRRIAIVCAIGGIVFLTWPRSDVENAGIPYRSALAVLTCWGLLTILAALEPPDVRKTLAMVGYVGLLFFWIMSIGMAEQRSRPPTYTAPPTPDSLSEHSPHCLPWPRAPARNVLSPALPCGVPADWLTPDDYPTEALRTGASGTTSIQGVIDISGRLNSCEVVASSGNRDLDEAACNLLTRRARFLPATGPDGRDVPSVWRTRIRWELPE
jgi:TonB family protein